MRDYSHIAMPPKPPPPTHRPVFFTDGPLAGELHLMPWHQTEFTITLTQALPPEDMPLEAKGFDPVLDVVIKHTEIKYCIDPESLPEPVRMPDLCTEWAYLAKVMS